MLVIYVIREQGVLSKIVSDLETAVRTQGLTVLTVLQYVTTPSRPGAAWGCNIL